MKKILCIAMCLFATGVIFTSCSKSSEKSSASAAVATTAQPVKEKKFKIAVSNAYMGNDWRQLMIKSLKVAASKEPYRDQVDLKIVNSENSAEAQSSAIDAMIEQGYDAILIDASSSTALIPAIKRALASGITVVTFDSVVHTDGVYTVQTDFVSMVQAWAKYLCTKCGEGAKIAVDTGMPGSTNGNTIYEAAMKVFDEYNMKVVAEYASQYADGICQEQLSSVLAANPDLDGIFCQAYTESCYSALTQAGMKLIPCATFDTNLGMVTAEKNNMDVIIGNNGPGIGVIAMDIALRVLKGETVEKDTYLSAGLFVNEKDKDIDVGMPTQVIKEGVNCWKDKADGLDWPLFPSTFSKVQISADDISDFNAN
ncbi:MAG: sugar ABC transporter substrate-binding protein [Spirochaetia bacterium]|jgi:ribose transport system substrate-binding protein|nr:sugar ABC transporter substrate-binding protein [Spirochaetia bacterium]